MLMYYTEAKVRSAEEDREMATRRDIWLTSEQVPADHGLSFEGRDCSSERGRNRIRLSPVAAICVAAIAFAVIFGFKNERFGWGDGNSPTCEPAQAVDLSLQRLMRFAHRPETGAPAAFEGVANREPGSR